MKKGFIVGIILIAIVLIGYLYFIQKGSEDEKTIIKVGVLTPLTGEGATYGTATKNGVLLALDLINSTEKFNKFQIIPIFEDSRFDPKTAINAIEKFANIDKVPVVLGPFGSSIVLSVADVANNNKLPIISASATADDIKNAGDFVFRTVPTNKLQGSEMAKYVIQHLGIKDHIAILALNNDYGISLSNSFADYIRKNNGKIIFEDRFDLGMKNYRTLLSRVKNVKPKFIYVPDHYTETGILLKQAKELGVNTIFGGGDGSYSPDLINIAGDATNGFLLTLMGIDNSEQKVYDFNIAYKKKFKKDPDVYSAYAYDAMFVIAMTIKSILSKNQDLNGETFKNSLYDIDYNGITGKTKFNKYGEVNKPFVIYEVINKKFRPLNIKKR